MSWITLISIKEQKSLQSVLIYRQIWKLFDGCGCFPQSWDTANSSPNFPREELVCFYFVFILMRNIFVLLQKIQNCPLGFPIHWAESMYLWQFYMCPITPLRRRSREGGICATLMFTTNDCTVTSLHRHWSFTKSRNSVFYRCIPSLNKGCHVIFNPQLLDELMNNVRYKIAVIAHCISWHTPQYLT